MSLAPRATRGVGKVHAGDLGHPRLHLRRATSTSDLARRLALQGAPHGTLVTAAEQTAGRGRQGRRWSAPPDSSLLMSLVLRWAPEDPPPASLPLIAGVAVCDVAGPETRVKWPNDIVIERPDGGLSKLAGILAEGRPQQGWAVLGIGLNVAVDLRELPQELRPNAASLDLAPAMIEPTLKRLLCALKRRLSEPTRDVLGELRSRDVLHGRDVSWTEGQGQAQGIDEQGRLVVRTAAGERVALSAGEVHLEALVQRPAPAAPPSGWMPG
jgi:BirA family biotin operon repressor/biotin-[acetyl-CoA-carboxylase] ligase